MLRAILELRLERNHQAADAFARAETLGARARDRRLGRAAALLRLGAAEEAFEILSGVMSENPADAEVAQWLLRAAVATERWSEAAEHLDRYLALRPADEAIRFAFASANARRGRWQLARTEHQHLCNQGSIRGIEDLDREPDADAALGPASRAGPPARNFAGGAYASRARQRSSISARSRSRPIKTNAPPPAGTFAAGSISKRPATAFTRTHSASPLVRTIPFIR